MAFEKIKNFFKKLYEIDTYNFINKLIPYLLLSITMSSVSLICTSFICLFLLVLKVKFTAYIMILLIMILTISLLFPFFIDFILNNIEQKIEQDKRFFLKFFWNILFKIQKKIIEFHLIKKINKINEYYSKNKPYIFNFLIGIIFLPTVFFTSFLFLSSAFNILKHLNFLVMLITMCIYLAVYIHVILFITYQATGLILLKADKFIKRNQPQSELKEENNNE